MCTQKVSKGRRLPGDVLMGRWNHLNRPVCPLWPRSKARPSSEILGYSLMSLISFFQSVAAAEGCRWALEHQVINEALCLTAQCPPQHNDLDRIRADAALFITQMHLNSSAQWSNFPQTQREPVSPRLAGSRPVSRPLLWKVALLRIWSPMFYDFNRLWVMVLKHILSKC